MESCYSVIVIGGGHAGAEAAWAAANMLRADDRRVAMVTMDATKIGQMSCNPAIGGLAKGQMVCEADALGGLMGLAIDATGIQFRMLNRSKGPAVRGPRAQADKYAYAREVQRLLGTRRNLDIIEGVVEELLVEDGRCCGVQIRDHKSEVINLSASAVVLTTGTFMRGLMHTGPRKTEGGRFGERAAVGISGNLRALGFELGRLKTGTPPRLDRNTIDFDALEQQPGDDPPTAFSAMTGVAADDGAYAKVSQRFPCLQQVHCWITHTNEAIHEMIRANLDRAPMYSGQIEAESGPRYCPSIEDKVVRFADKASHQVFLEPESLETDEIYCNGISTSLPTDVQDFVVANLPGCERAKILRYGYAVEYDMVRPHQIDATCMTKRVAGLLLAGQINGTSGYEEAAGQGLVAGLNAVRYVRSEELVRLGRDQAYIGVMMDDLVTKTPREPYRMFTSRAEHRLLLRADNAVDRLTPTGRAWGLVDDARWAQYCLRRDAIDALERYVCEHSVDGRKMIDRMRRPQTSELDVLSWLDADPLPAMARDAAVVGALLSRVKYAGFVVRHRQEHQRLRAMEGRQLPMDFDYARIRGMRGEAGLVMNRFKPATLGQASRLAGITPADLTVLTVALGLR
jgi:tRNA uridine 5-carboxymethylaminomethyl modification enzyme